MIDFNVVIEPFVDSATCGDFCIFTEKEDYFYLAIGDVGGHGSVNTGNVARLCTDVIMQNLDKPLDELLLQIHSLEDVRKRGLVLMLARVYKKTPIFEHVCVGNMKLKLVRHSVISDMSIQEGIVGYQIPTHINTNLMKLNKKDRLIMATDGLSLYNDKLKDRIESDQTSKALSEMLMTDFNRKHDDALVGVLTWNVSDSHFVAIKNTYQGVQ